MNKNILVNTLLLGIILLPCFNLDAHRDNIISPITGTYFTVVTLLCNLLKFTITPLNSNWGTIINGIVIYIVTTEFKAEDIFKPIRFAAA